MKFSRSGYLFVIFSLSLFLVSFLLVLIFFSFNFFTKGDYRDYTSVRNEKMNNFRYLHFNSEKNEIVSKGFSSLSQDIDDGFLSFQSDNVNYHLISPFGSTEYRCYGTCVCLEENRRRSTNVVNKGLVFLLAAFSSISALTLSKNHFQDECVRINSDKCDPSYIQSEVTECSELLRDEELNIDLVDESSKEEDDDEDGPFNYMCKGNCVPTSSTKKELKSPSSLIRYETTPEEFKFFKCEDMVQMGMVKVDPKLVETKKYDLKRYNMHNLPYDGKLDFFAKKEFERLNLGTYCWENSRYKFFYEYVDHKGSVVKNQASEASWCFSGTSKGFLNPSIRCLRVRGKN